MRTREQASGSASRTDRPTVTVDGRALLVEPLLAMVAAESVLMCAVDLEEGARHDAAPGARSTTPDRLRAALTDAPTLVLVHGNLSWHALRVLAPLLDVAAGDRAPILVFEAGPPDPVPDWASLESQAAQLRRVEAITRGIFAGVDRLARSLDHDPIVVRCGLGRVTAAVVPRSAPEPVASWVATAAPILDQLERERTAGNDARSASDDLEAELHHVELLTREVLRSPRWLHPDLVRALRSIERRRFVSGAGRAAHRLGRAAPAPETAANGSAPEARSSSRLARARERMDAIGCGLDQLAEIGTTSLIRGPHIELGQRAKAAWLVEERTRPQRATVAEHPPSPRPPIGGADQGAAESSVRITYVLPILRIAGGILGVTQLANELRLLGADTRIVAAEDRAEVYRWRFLAPPTVFAGPDALIDGVEPTDVVVATHWSTVAWADEIVRSGRARAAAYFLQDYEAWFYPDDGDLQEAVRATYGRIGPKIVKSDWLAGLLEADGHATHKIVLGYDLGFFHPRAVDRPDHPVIIAMARPRTPRRGFTTLVAALDRVHREVPDAEIVLFGSDLDGLDLPFPHRSIGMVTDQELLARLYSGAHVHIDASDFQAFGRPALEAMGCGAASVLTDVGGVGEYARHERNCLLVPPGDPDAMAAAVVRLCVDVALRDRIRHAGFDTVIRYSMKQEARSTLALFEQLAASAPTVEGSDPGGHGPLQVEQVGGQQR